MKKAFNFLLSNRHLAHCTGIFTMCFLVIVQVAVFVNYGASDTKRELINLMLNIVAETMILMLYGRSCFSKYFSAESLNYEILIIIEFISIAINSLVVVIYGAVGQTIHMDILCIVGFIFAAEYWLCYLFLQRSSFKNTKISIIPGYVFAATGIIYLSYCLGKFFAMNIAKTTEKSFIAYTPDLGFPSFWFSMVLIYYLIVCLISGENRNTKLNFFSYAFFPAVYMAVVFTAKAVGINLFFGGILKMCETFSAFLIFLTIQANQEKALATRERELSTAKFQIMVSQIQPHFISNTLGMIRSMYRYDADGAEKAMNTFISFLQKNFSELYSDTLIPAEREIEHVKEFMYLELMRWPDMAVEYDIQATNFALPSTTIQPLVENAIKHGLMPLEHGGKIKLSVLEMKDEFQVIVEDNGVGFDIDNPKPQTDDHRRHIGLSNIRDRLELMCGGCLEISSNIGIGTVATVHIPKGEKR